MALLKSAFLFAFALLGYRYCVSPLGRAIRTQLRNPNQEIFPTVTLKFAGPIQDGVLIDDANRILLISFLGYLVMLPYFTDTLEEYQVRVQSLSASEDHKLDVILVALPNEFRGVLDFELVDNAVQSENFEVQGSP